MVSVYVAEDLYARLVEGAESLLVVVAPANSSLGFAGSPLVLGVVKASVDSARDVNDFVHSVRTADCFGGVVIGSAHSVEVPRGSVGSVDVPSGFPGVL